MPIVSDFTKTSEQIVLDLINFDNGSSLSSADVSFSSPEVNSAGNPVRNTILTVSAVPGSGFTGSVPVEYDRVDLVNLAGGMSNTFQIGDATMVSDIVPEINARYGVNLQTEDYTDVILPTFAGTPNEVQVSSVVAKPTSLVWLGTFEFQLRAEDIQLSTVITNIILNGLVYTPSQPGAGGDVGGIGLANDVGYFEEMIPYIAA